MITSATKLHNLGSIQSFFPWLKGCSYHNNSLWYNAIAKEKTSFLDGDLRDYDICSIKLK
jgi:hypothetical protein